MAHKLYTTYLSNMKKIPEGTLTAIIMRMPPASIHKMDNVIHVPQLSPKKEVLYAYRNTKDWNEFIKEFNKQMTEDKETMEYISLLMEGLDNNDVVLVCCEKDSTQCHRSLIANYIKELGYEIEEL